jgi:putative restriction endonuclease
VELTHEEVLAQFRDIRQWRSGDHRAPHKPLLLLLALGRLQARGERLMSFEEAEEPLRRLLEQFGHPRRRQRPEYPFWRLRLDGDLWEIEGEDRVETTQSGDPLLTSLRGQGIRGGFSSGVAARLLEDPDLLERVAAALLENHFPPSLHEDICAAVGLRARMRISDQVRRDPEFRVEVLRAYEYRCAMCGYDGRLDTIPVGLDAAHVRWWAYGGPDTIDNGIALCALHHRALDRGVVSVSLDHRVIVSRRFNGSGRARELIIDLAGKPLHPPQHGLPVPAADHLAWHGTEVFNGEARTPAADARATEDRPPFRV